MGFSNGSSRSDVVTPGAGAVVKTGIDGTSMEVRSEMAATAVAERQKATIQALFVMAERRPRDWTVVRGKLMKECERPGFAEVARYSKPVGNNNIEGPSIRFAEAAIRNMGNLFVDCQVTLEDQFKRKIEVVIIDLENCVRYAREVVVEKTVERNFLKDGQQSLSSRTNSYGKTVYRVEATEDDLANKQAAAISKVLRTEGLRLLPGDILEDCMDMCIETLSKKDAKDPAQAWKKLADGFSALNVSAEDLKAYLGFSLEKVTPKDLASLRGIYAAIRDGETTWAAVMESRKAADPAPTNGTKPSAVPGANAAPARTATPAQGIPAVQAAAKTEPAAAPASSATVDAQPSQPASDDPDSFTESIKRRMSEAVAAGDGGALLRVAAETEKVPLDRQEEVLRHYTECKKELGKRAAGGAA